MRSFLFEGKLTAADRRELPVAMFGLPKDRKYPLHDEEHVRRAIQFFGYAPPKSRSELANNINRRIRELKMDVTIGKDSAFYSYREKRLVKEGSFSDIECVPTYEGSVKEAIDKLSTMYGVHMGAVVQMVHEMKSLDDFIQVEEMVHLISTPQHVRDFPVNKIVIHGRGRYDNPYTLINGIMQECYRSAFEFFRYNSDLPTYNSWLLYNIIEDMYKHMWDDVTTQSRQSYRDHMKNTCEIVENYECNYYHIARKTRELEFELDVAVRLNCGPKTPMGSESAQMEEMKSMYKECQLLANNLAGKLHNKQNSSRIIVTPATVRSIIDGPAEGINSYETTQYLKLVKKEIESEIDIIRLHNDVEHGSGKTSIPERLTFGDDVIRYLDGSICADNVRLYKKSLNICLDPKSLIIFQDCGNFEEIHTGKDMYGSPVYYGVSKNAIYLLAETDNDSGEYYQILLKNESGECAHLLNLICSENDFDYSKKLKAIRIMAIPGFKRSRSALLPLTEGFYIDGEGNMKFKFSPRKSYMDEYAENHKILVANSKAKNIEGMKTNLAFLFALINQIEREVIHGNNPKKLTQDYIQNATKARSFALNDFKTYMKQVLAAEPNFDFAEYYKESDYGKFVVTVDKEEVVGIKKLVKALML